VSEPVPPPAWSSNSDGLLVTTARNLSTRYLVLIAELVIGMLMLPFNLAHLGASQYGLWMLVGSITVHFSLLDMGYGSATVKFIAQYRAHRDARALNEIASTLFYIFAGVGLLAYGSPRCSRSISITSSRSRPSRSRRASGCCSSSPSSWRSTSLSACSAASRAASSATTSTTSSR
jgi:hypothetical protein